MSIQTARERNLAYTTPEPTPRRPPPVVAAHRSNEAIHASLTASLAALDRAIALTRRRMAAISTISVEA